MPVRKIKPKPRKSPLETAVVLLTKQPMARLALQKKLRDKGYSAKEAEETVSECERYGYINDKLIAEAKVAMMRDRGDGSRKIKLSLRLKGFGKESAGDRRSISKSVFIRNTNAHSSISSPLISLFRH